MYLENSLDERGLAGQYDRRKIKLCKISNVNENKYAKKKSIQSDE